MQAETRKQNVQAPEIGICARSSSAAADASSSRRMPSRTSARRDERRPLERQPEHLEVRHAEPPPDLGGADRERPRRLGVAAHVGDVALLEGQPAVLGAWAERLEQAPRALEPPAGHGRGAVEVELVDRQPGGRARGARGVARVAVAAVGPLARGERRRLVVEPPRGPGEPLEVLRASPRPRSRPAAADQRPARRCSHPSSARLLASLLGGRTGDHPAGLAAADPGGASSSSIDAPRAWSARNESLEVFSSRRRTR